MKCRSKMIALLAGVMILTAGTAQAVNITIFDGQGSGTGWNGAQEDQEVAANCQTGQIWDLEGFYLNGNTLSIVGGYNFMYGQSGFLSGDIFIDTTGDVKYGVDDYGSVSPNGTSVADGYSTVTNKWGYDWAIDLDFMTLNYTIYEINSDTLVMSYYRQNDESNPFELAQAYKTGGTTGTFTYASGLNDAAAVGAGYGSLHGGWHNVVSLDFSTFLTPGSTVTTHFTMGCGNDNLMGQTTAVPEPGTLLLLGAGLVGLAGLRRRKRN